MKHVLILAGIFAAVAGLSACEPKTQQQKDFVEFRKYCAENPRNDACVKYREEESGFSGPTGK